MGKRQFLGGAVRQEGGGQYILFRVCPTPFLPTVSPSALLSSTPLGCEQVSLHVPSLRSGVE